MKKLVNYVFVVVVLVAFTSCKKKIVKEEKIETIIHSDQKVSKDCKDVHWSHHTGEDGPENWGTLCTKFSDCEGKIQSPINIVSKETVATGLSKIEFTYGTSKVDIINNGHTVQFNVSGDNTVILKEKKYKLLQFHYHALSEHTIEGKHSPIEVHFVHKHSDSDYAVLGIMIEEGKENGLFNTYLGDFSTTKGKFNSEKEIDLLSLFPKTKGYYNYSGSLTTPPCSQVVDWFVLKTPITASKEQIAQFSKILHDNYRPIQQLNDRVVGAFE